MLWQQTIGAILDNYADAIEGGNSYRGSGTAYVGAPGTRSTVEWVAENGSISSVANGSTTTIVSNGIHTSIAKNLIRVDGPPMFAVCTSATNSANVNAARKITAFSNNTFTVAAFPAATTSADAFTILEGFKRERDSWDLDAEETIPAGLDRRFRLEMLPGRRLAYYGTTVATFEAELVLTLRILKHYRAHEAAASALENSAILRNVLCKPSLRDGTYTQIVKSEESAPTIIVDDKNKVIVEDRLGIIYRVSTLQA